MIRWSRVFTFTLLLLAACSRDDVEQIEVNIPDGVTVPEGMVYIPAGEFVMGHADDPKTVLGKKINLPHFFIDQFETTREAYSKWKKDFTFHPGAAKYPVDHVTFFEARDFCKAMQKRLPTEAEWEKAARGTDGRKWPWLMFQQHPNNGFSGFLPEAVDKRDEWISPYGVYGMGHNVWEWTADDYDFNGMPGKDKGKYKVVRGGLFQSHLKIDFSATYSRNFMVPEARYNFLGLRCAKDVG